MERLRLGLELVAELGRRDLDELARALLDGVPEERGDAVLGDDIMHVIARCGDAGAVLQHRHELADGPAVLLLGGQLIEMTLQLRTRVALEGSAMIGMPPLER